MKTKLQTIFTLILIIFLNNNSNAQTQENPLEQLSYYIGIWGPPSDHPMMERNPKMIDLKVISFEWRKNKKVISSKTGLFSDQKNEAFSEGMITFNPNTQKLVWLEYQVQNDILFEGEYISLGGNKFQRVYTVYYVKDYQKIPNPQLDGWTRKYRETFIPTSGDTIDWLTEAWVDQKWVKQRQNNGDFKAVRDNRLNKKELTIIIIFNLFIMRYLKNSLGWIQTYNFLLLI